MKRAKRSKQSKVSTIKALADASWSAVFVFKWPLFNCVYMNSASRNLLHHTKANSFSARELEPTEGRKSTEHFQISLLESDNTVQRLTIGLPDGTTKPVRAKVRVMTGKTQKFTILSIDDLSHVKRLERSLAAKQDEIFRLYHEVLEQNETLKVLDQAKHNFMLTAAHELRTPLASIIGTADLMVQKLYDTPEQLDSLISIVHSEGLHLLNILTDTLDYLQLQAGQIDLYLENLEIETLVKTQLKAFESRAQSRNIEFEIVTDKNAATKDLHAYVDPRRFRQLFNNLIDNAIQYSPAGERISIRIDNRDKFIRLTVQDRGQGMSPGQANQIYSKHTTIENALVQYKGTGLGMGFTKKIIESMGGKISFFTSIGVGTTFVVEFPTEMVLDESYYRKRSDTIDDLAS